MAGDATYGNEKFLRWLMERGITPYMRTRDSALRKNSPLYGPDRFTHLPESNSYLCPVGQQLNHGGQNARNRTASTSGPANTVGRARKKRNAQAHRRNILLSTCVSPPGNTRET